MTTIPQRVLNQARQICPECDRPEDIVKFGFRNGVQVYKCKPCNKKFTDNGALAGRRVPPQQVGAALSMFFEGMSYRDIRRNMQQQFGITPSTATLYEWVVQYTQRGRRLMDDFKARTGERWVADETVIKVDGGNVWLWNVMDADSRYLLATHISRTRTIKDAETLFKRARRRATRTPREIVTDGLRAYQEGIERNFGGNTRHVVSGGITAEINNNLSERMQGTVKDRTKVMRGLEFKRTAEIFVDGFRLHYNHMRPHASLNGRTPAEAADIPFTFKDWQEVAFLQDTTFETPVKMERFRDRTFSKRRGRL